MKEDKFDQIAHRYKVAIAAKYRAIRPDDIKSIPTGKCWVSRKFDGELWFAELTKDQVSIFARNGRKLKDGKIPDYLQKLSIDPYKTLILAGELYSPSNTGRERVGNVSSAISKSKWDSLSFVIFDVVEVDGKIPPIEYEERLSILEKLIPKSNTQVTIIETKELDEPALIKNYYEELVGKDNAEGVIVRAKNDITYKIKPSFTIDALAVGFTTKVGELDQIRSVLLGLRREDGNIQLIGSCGNFIGNELRRTMFDKFTSSECKSEFRHSSSDGNLYRFVKPQIVLEVRCTDIQTEDSSGRTVRRWVLKYEKNNWFSIADSPSASLIHGVVLRQRTDKQPDYEDTRVSQINEHVQLEDLNKKLVARKLPKSQLTMRQGWTKQSKGGLAIRKILIWKTNKENVWEGWPAWVIHFTDYSPSRKSPLDRKIRTALSQEEANIIADQLVENNIKKGWTPIKLEQ